MKFGHYEVNILVNKCPIREFTDPTNGKVYIIAVPGTSYEIAFHNDGDEPVCFAPVIDGKNMHWSYRVPEHATHVLSGHLDGDKIFPFQFATTPLASTSADVSNNQSLGSIKFIAKNIIKTEPTTISTTIPEHKKVNLNDSFAKKTTSIGTQLGEPQLQKLASITRTCCSGNTILAKVECQVKSPLAMLSEKILSPAWKHWWDYEQQAYGMNNLEWVDPSFSSGLTTKSLENEKNSFLIGPATEAPNTAKFNKVLSKIGLMVNYGPKALLEVLASLICGKSKTDAVIGYLTQQWASEDFEDTSQQAILLQCFANCFGCPLFIYRYNNTEGNNSLYDIIEVAPKVERKVWAYGYLEYLPTRRSLCSFPYLRNFRLPRRPVSKK